MSGPALRWVDHHLPVKVSRSERAVLRDHASRANTYWASWAATEGIAKRTQYAPRTVENCERSLVQKKLLIPVPWVTNYGRETSSGYFLAGVFQEFEKLPDVEVAFKERIEFRDRKTGRVVGGLPRVGGVPSWWSGRGRGVQSEGSQDETPKRELRGPKNSALRGPTHGTPITTISNHQRKEPTDAADAASSVDADASTSCDADASRCARHDQPERAKPKRRQSLAAYLKTLGSDAINEIYWDLESTSKGKTLKWAEPRARKELKIPEGDWPNDDADADARLTLKVVEIAIYTLRKRSYGEFGEIAEYHLDGFEWPPEKNLPLAATGASGSPLRYRHSPSFLYAPKGHEDACVATIHAAIDRMPAAEIAASLALFERHRSEILANCRRVAAKTASLRDSNGHDRQTLHAALEYYRDWHRDKPQTKFPKFVVPIELHPTQQPAADAA